jgi:predicted CXXCH cytochrome family protein
MGTVLPRLLRFLAIILYCILPVMAAAAEKVPHHGTLADSSGRVRDCISCHDGTAGSMVPVCASKCKTSEKHSVLKRYPPKKHAEDYAPVRVVRSKGLKIVNGKVTCISCHDLKIGNEYHLIIENQKVLCGTCHLKP